MAASLPSAHQRKLGPAPIASFEDLSDEVDNNACILRSWPKTRSVSTCFEVFKPSSPAQGGETASTVARMPGIVEVTAPLEGLAAASSLKTPSTPRIDISRASSSSHHEEDSNSRESTPEKELLAGIAPQEGCSLQLGYKEDAQDLCSSTEELDLHDPVHEQDLRREAKRSRRRANKEPHDGTQSEHGMSMRLSQGERERKDSNCSEIILLNISGRTSRLSSVGSQGSGVSGGGLSVVSAASSRSPSPHKCLLETSFCGSVSTLANTLSEPSKPETDDLAKVLLKREEDSTRALIPESIRVPMVGGNLKPDPLDMPRRRGREERKEIFRREVEITKRVLKRVNIEVPIIKLPKEPDTDETPRAVGSDVQKPASLDLNDRCKRSPSTASTSSRSGGSGGSVLDSSKLHRHQKIRDLEGSRTPSPSSFSRKGSFASLFKGRTDGSSSVQHQGQESPTTTAASGSRRTSLANRLKETAESLRSRSKSRERPSSGEKSPGGRRPDSRSRGSVFSSTLSLFRKRERKRSGDGSTGTPDTLDGSHGNLEGIGCVEFSFNQQHTPSKKEDAIFISLYGENDEFRNREESTELPSETASIPLDSPTQTIDDENDASSPQQSAMNIVCTDATIEHHRKSRRSRDGVRISSSSGDSSRILESNSRDSQISKSESRDSKISMDIRREVTDPGQQPLTENREDARLQRMSTSSSRESIAKKPDIVKPKRKNTTKASRPTSEPPPPPTKIEMNGKPPISGSKEVKLARELLPPEQPLTKTPSVVSDLDHNSSGSERDSEIDFIRNKAEKGLEELPDERKGLCYEESFEEDLPYVPTTLPLEKSVAMPMMPVKQRLQEVRTTPIDRPRSTTPINPTLLDEFIMHTSHEERQRRADKMRISLPREDSFRLKSPHRPSTHNSFTEFAGRVSANSRGLSLTMSPSPPPPLPPRAPTSASSPGGRPANWINFEEIPEKRKAPKRIQTIPRLDEDTKHPQSSAANSDQYSYVQPEECRCECHEESRRASLQRDGTAAALGYQSSSANICARAPTAEAGDSSGGVCNGESCSGSGSGGGGHSSSAATNADRTSIVSDNSSLECSLSADYTPDMQHRSGSNGGTRPFGMDLDMSSNRSSIISQEDAEDEHLESRGVEEGSLI